MQIDPSLHSTADNYKILTNLVIPRPIAWGTTTSPRGVINLAPFSFFNAVGADPLYVIINIGHNDAGEPKDVAQRCGPVAVKSRNNHRNQFAIPIASQRAFRNDCADWEVGTGDSHAHKTSHGNAKVCRQSAWRLTYRFDSSQTNIC